MACQIDGCTLHHWSGIPVGETDGTALTKDAHKLATKWQSLRWVLIDEVSMISAQLVRALLIGKVTWKRDSWKRRADGTQRPFGGLWWIGRNVLREILAAEASIGDHLG